MGGKKNFRRHAHRGSFQLLEAQAVRMLGRELEGFSVKECAQLLTAGAIDRGIPPPPGMVFCEPKQWRVDVLRAWLDRYAPKLKSEKRAKSVSNAQTETETSQTSAG